MLVLMPVFEADLEPEQYGYRPGRSAKDAVRRVHRLLHKGRNEVIEADLSNYFGEIPHAELMKSIARRVSNGRMLGLIKAWLEMPVVEEDGKGGTRRTNRARKDRKGTPQGAPISPLLSNIYMRRFILGWKARGANRVPWVPHRLELSSDGRVQVHRHPAELDLSAGTSDSLTPPLPART